MGSPFPQAIFYLVLRLWLFFGVRERSYSTPDAVKDLLTLRFVEDTTSCRAMAITSLKSMHASMIGLDPFMASLDVVYIYI